MRDLQALQVNTGRTRGVDLRLVDGSVAVLCGALALVSLLGRIMPLGQDDGIFVPFLPADLLGVSLVLLGSGALLLRRRYPLPVLALVGLSWFLVESLGYIPPPLPAAELVIVYTVATTLPTVVSTCATLTIALSIVTADLIHEAALNDDKLLAYVLSVAGAWTLGHFLKVSRTQAAIAQQNVLLLTQHQQATTEKAVRQEQERLSRELHDVVAHSVGVIVAQASAARLVFRQEPEFAFGALSAIESTGRAALAEMRVMLRVVHGDDDGESGTRTPRDITPPAATLAQLPLLCERMEAGGLQVELSWRGTPVLLPPSIDLAAYRIVQESLTNCLKHAGSARATVVISYQEGRLDLQISDNGVEQPAGDPGRGLVGMHQRASLLGGVVTAGRVAAGFKVRAILPLPESQSWPSVS
ncbi:MAG: hypothetical protein QOE58_767 [Actinomycetota bacterium]|nr:hypothetical protein [Actinomycetota bacterium]